MKYSHDPEAIAHLQLAWHEQKGRRKVFFEEDGSLKRGKKEGRPASSRSLSSALQCNDAAFVDFVRLCLIWSPEQRITPAQALTHSWIRGGSLEPEVPTPISSSFRSRSFIALAPHSNKGANPKTVSKVLTARQINDPPLSIAAKNAMKVAGIGHKGLNKSSSWLLIPPSTTTTTVAAAVGAKDQKAQHKPHIKVEPHGSKPGKETAVSPKGVVSHKRQECLLLHIMSRNQAGAKPSSQKRIAKQASIC